MSGEFHPMFGKKHSEEFKQKIQDTLKKKYPNGRPVWNKGLPHSEATKKKVSDSKKGKPSNSSTKFKKGISSWAKGRGGYWMKGSKNTNWKGGITPINNKIRQSLEYKLWQDSVFNRDCNHCQKCGENRINKLTAHHILNFAQWLDLRLAIDNGITFCFKCHKEFHHTFGLKNNNQEQVKKFIAD